MTKKCPSCEAEVSSSTTKCPYCGKEFRNWFKRHPILTAIIGFFVLSNIIGSLTPLFYNRKESSPEDSTVNISPPPSLQNSERIEVIFDAKTITGKTVSDMEQILGTPSSHIKPSGRMYGEIAWKKVGIDLSSSYLSKNESPSGFEFQFPGINLSFSSDDFNRAFQLVGLGLTKNQFENTSPQGFTRYDAKNLVGFKKITVQSTTEDKAHIGSILFVQTCEPESLCR